MAHWQSTVLRTVAANHTSESDRPSTGVLPRLRSAVCSKYTYVGDRCGRCGRCGVSSITVSPFKFLHLQDTGKGLVVNCCAAFLLFGIYLRQFYVSRQTESVATFTDRTSTYSCACQHCNWTHSFWWHRSHTVRQCMVTQFSLMYDGVWAGLMTANCPMHHWSYWWCSLILLMFQLLLSVQQRCGSFSYGRSIGSPNISSFIHFIIKWHEFIPELSASEQDSADLY